VGNQRASKRKEISALLSVVLGGGVFAVLVAMGLVYFYGPSGLYDAKYSLLSPDMLHELKYQDVNPQTGSRQLFVFDSIEFTYFHQGEGKWKKVTVDEAQYRKLYEMIGKDVSVEEVTTAITDQFLSGYLATLKIVVHPDDKHSQLTKIFQEVTFAYQGDYFRIELHEQSTQQMWAYFFHKDIYQTALEILK
jgi:hypothetical protein